MSVESATNKIVCVGNGLSRVWPFPFDLPSAADMQVFLTAPDGTPERLTGGYRVSGKTLIYPADASVDALPAGYRLTLRRWVAFTQGTKLPNDGEFLAETLESAYDNLEYQIQQLAEVAGRAITAPVDDSLSAEELSAQVVENHERYDEIARKHTETLSARDAAQLSASSAVSSADAALWAKESAEMSAAAAEAAREAVMSASFVPPWDASAVYGYPDMVCCVDGHTYRCIGTNNLNDYPPESAQWVRVTVIQQAGTYDMESGGTFGDAAAAFVSGGSF